MTPTIDITTQIALEATQLLPLCEILTGTAQRAQGQPDDMEAAHDLVRQAQLVEEAVERIAEALKEMRGISRS